MLIQEYDNFYTRNPKQWDNSTHDEFVLDILRSYDRPDTLLDIGCGNGHLLKHLSTHWPTSKRYDMEFWGLDFSPVAIDLASQSVPDANFVLSDIQNMGMSSYFDMITCVGVAEHFIDPLDGLRQCRKMLKKNGAMYLEVPNCLVYRSNKGCGEGYFRINQGSKQLEWHLLRETWEYLIIKAGFTILETIKGPQPQNEFIWILKHE